MNYKITYKSPLERKILQWYFLEKGNKKLNSIDTHDKYANQESSYLLQRLEMHPGLVTLAFIMKSDMLPYNDLLQGICKSMRKRGSCHDKIKVVYLQKKQ